MTVSGNANAALFFKKHGFNDLQTQSDKKYKSKAAQEYRRHLSKLLQDKDGSNLRSVSDDANDTTTSENAEWETGKGLDNLLKSVSDENIKDMDQEQTSSPRTVFTAVASSSESTTTVKKAPSNPDIGTLSIASKEEDAVASGIAKSMNGTLKIGGKGGAKKAKKIGARKLNVSNEKEVTLESFDIVEKRAEVAAQEQEDHKLAIKLQSDESGNTGSGGSSRLAAIYAESESIYTSSTSQKSNSSSNDNYSYVKPSSSVGSSPRNASYTGNVGQGYAQEKFSTAKSISSDQYFGRDENDEQTSMMRDRISNFHGATAISSDMLNGNADNRSRSSSGDVGLDGLQALKESVNDFFNNISGKM